MANKDKEQAKDRGLWYNLGDNLIGYEDEVETPGEKLGKDTKAAIEAVSKDPLGVLKALGVALKEQAEDIAAGPVAYTKTDRVANPDGTVPLTKKEKEDQVLSVLGLAAVPASPALTAAGKMPDPTTLNIFAGRSALDDMEPIYDAATEMKLKGASNKEIWEKYGVEFDEINKQWQFVIDPRKMKLTAHAENAYETLAPLLRAEPNKRFSININDLIQFEDLKRNYPNLKDTKLVVTNKINGGQFSVDRNELAVSPNILKDPDLLKKVIVHELQHFVQAHDGSIGGASPKYFYDDRSINKLYGGNKVYTYSHDPKLKGLTEQINILLDRKEKVYKRLDVDDEVGELFGSPKDMEEYAQILTSLSKKHREAKSRAFELYKANAGEAEARAAEDLLDVVGSLKNSKSPSELKSSQRGDVLPADKSYSYMPTSRMEQPDGYNEGGVVMDPEVDPVSGNEIPVGATAKEVRDDVPINASEGEYVIPANVVRYFGVSHFEKLIEKANKGLAEMVEKGRMGNEPEEPVGEEPIEMADGGMIPPYNPAQMPTGFSTFGTQGSTTAGAPAVENKIYMGPDGSRRVIMFINGQPVNDIPDGYVPDTPENRRAQELASEEAVKAAKREGGTTGAENAENTPDPADYAGMTPEGRAAAVSAGDKFAGVLGAMFGGPLGAQAARALHGKSVRDTMKDQELSDKEIEDALGKRGLLDRITGKTSSRSSDVSFDPDTGMFSKDGIEVSKDLMDRVSEAVNSPTPATSAPSAPSPSGVAGDTDGDGDVDGDDGVGYGGADSDAFGYNKGGLVTKPKGKRTKKSSGKGLATRC